MSLSDQIGRIICKADKAILSIEQAPRSIIQTAGSGTSDTMNCKHFSFERAGIISDITQQQIALHLIV